MVSHTGTLVGPHCARMSADWRWNSFVSPPPTATKSGRSKRIFIDYLRNSREATAVAPYSTRARPGAPVSVPIEWSELGSLKSANQYTVLNLMQRLSRQRKDPWTGIGRVRQSLSKLK